MKKLFALLCFTSLAYAQKIKIINDTLFHFKITTKEGIIKILPESKGKVSLEPQEIMVTGYAFTDMFLQSPLKTKKKTITTRSNKIWFYRTETNWNVKVSAWPFGL